MSLSSSFMSAFVRFDPVTFKASLQLARVHMRHSSKKCEAVVKELTREVVPLLRCGKEASVRMKATQALVHTKYQNGYQLLHDMIQTLLDRLAYIEKVRSVPSDLQEAIHSIVYCSPRLGNNALGGVVNQLAAKFGRKLSKEVFKEGGCLAHPQLSICFDSRIEHSEREILDWLETVAQQHGVHWLSPSPSSECLPAVSNPQSADGTHDSFHASSEGSAEFIPSPTYDCLAAETVGQELMSTRFAESSPSPSPSRFAKIRRVATEKLGEPLKSPRCR
eukprot:CAMPEP_0113846204 /NCGR_PEP_ID=MMETSP0372-20130328/1179_1 /TAXON_ID=340204 /ORGANISM="Lankesteria abbotti" /LENGTH=276 /DNA_ID=CAMNT_0000815325 /DNA_START=75 /DNA_END=905 /DNA_ORIENTATION=- /assembly_acc=CAM_ASM_000359